MPFLPPNQQRQSTEGKMKAINCHENVMERELDVSKIYKI